MCFFWISSQLSVNWSLLIHSTHFLGILQPLVSTESSEIKKKGQIEKLFNDFLANRDYFQQNLKRCHKFRHCILRKIDFSPQFFFDKRKVSKVFRKNFFYVEKHNFTSFGAI